MDFTTEVASRFNVVSKKKTVSDTDSAIQSKCIKLFIESVGYPRKEGYCKIICIYYKNL